MKDERGALPVGKRKLKHPLNVIKAQKECDQLKDISKTQALYDA